MTTSLGSFRTCCSERRQLKNCSCLPFSSSSSRTSLPPSRAKHGRKPYLKKWCNWGLSQPRSGYGLTLHATIKKPLGTAVLRWVHFQDHKRFTGRDQQASFKQQRPKASRLQNLSQSHRHGLYPHRRQARTQCSPTCDSEEAKLSDKYFHCKANCEASRCGKYGEGRSM